MDIVKINEKQTLFPSEGMPPFIVIFVSTDNEAKPILVRVKDLDGESYDYKNVMFTKSK